MRVGVAVLTYRCGDAVEATLDAVARSSRQPDLLIVVDNASGDGTVSAVRRAAPGVELLELATNDGYGAAMNVAARRLVLGGAEMVVCLTHDCVLEPRALAALEQALEASPSTGAAGPVLARVSAPTVVWSAGGVLAGVRMVPRHRGSGTRLAAWAGGTESDETWLDGAALAVRSTAFTELGGFREDLFLYWEDVDLCLRLLAAGWAVRLVPQAVARQEPSWAPPYLATRNKLLVLHAQRGLTGLAAGCVDAVLLAARDAVRMRRVASGRSTALLRLTGLRDGLLGRLDRDAAGERSSVPVS